MSRAHVQSGLTVVEVLIGSAIIAMFLAASFSVFHYALQLSGRTTRSTQALYLAEEGVEAVKLMRDRGWQSTIGPLTVGTTYYLEFTGTTWQATTTNIFVDSLFERKFVRTAVNRDSTTKDIVTVGGTTDASTTLVTVTVSWREGVATSTRAISTYLSNIFGT